MPVDFHVRRQQEMDFFIDYDWYFGHTEVMV